MAFFKYNPDEQKKFGDTGESFIKVPKDKLFLPQPQQYKLRLLPPWSRMGLFAKYVKIHWGVGSMQLRTLCPDLYTPGSCNFCKVYHSFGDEYQNYKEEAQSVKAQDRFYSNIVNVQEPHKGVLVWSYGKTIYRLLKGIQDSSDFGDITDPDNGSDINLTRTGQGRNVQDTIYPVRNPSKLANPTWLDELFDLDSIFKEPDIAEVQAAFETHPWKTDFVYKHGIVKPHGVSESKPPRPVENSTRPVETPMTSAPVEVKTPEVKLPEDGKVADVVQDEVSMQDRYKKLEELERKMKEKFAAKQE
jgi:hypothetical protein